MLNEHIYKQPLVVFLGAGAPAPLGKMTTVDFLNWVRTRDEIDWRLINQIIENIEPSKEVNKMPDIEAVLDYLEKLIEGAEAYNKLGPSVSFDDFAKLRAQIESFVITHYSEINASKAFSHYKPLLQELPTAILPIFTTNYDLSIEKAYEHQKTQFRLRLIDGFERTAVTIPRWSETAYRDYKPRKKSNDIILFKLHGSVDWHRTPSGEIQRIEARQRNPGDLKTIVVYPSRTKREIHEEPFRTNYDYLLACLTYAKLCVVIGFSFRDQEVTEHFREASGMNPNLEVVIFDRNKAIRSYAEAKFYPACGISFVSVPTELSKENITFAIELTKKYLERRKIA